MEKLLILAAGAAFALACVAVAVSMARAARPPLRLPREDLMAGDTPDEGDRIIDALRPEAPSPIDRTAPILDLEPIEVARIEEADRRAGRGRAGDAALGHPADPHRARETR